MNRIRRLTQLCFLGLFLTLFLYVCCPYPANPAKISGGWTPQEVDPQTEKIVVVHDAPSNWMVAGRSVFLVDSETKKELGEFRIETQRKEGTTLRPDSKLSPEAWDELSTSFGPWTICERSPTAWPNHYETARNSKEFLPAATFLYLDPLIGLSVWWLGSVLLAPAIGCGIVVFLSVLFPRCFCGFVCPLGTLVDFSDFLFSFPKRPGSVAAMEIFRPLRYISLIAVVVSGLFGVSLVGFVAPIPILSSFLSAVATPLETAWFRAWYQVPPWDAAQALAVLLFVAVLLLGIIAPRFWCRFLCPSGALLSLTAPLRLFEIDVDRSKCISCGRCTKICSFGAVDESINVQHRDCTSCLACIECCPTNAIRFRNRIFIGSEPGVSAPGGIKVDAVNVRREFLGVVCGLVGGAAAAFGIQRTETGKAPLRPPGSQDEGEFLKLCVRCGECLQACPNNALQPIGVENGLEQIWTPRLVPDWSGCEPSCNNCGHVCPTGAIRALTMEQKRSFVIGVAKIDVKRCLPFATGEECKLCVDECSQAGYDALEFVSVGTEVDELGNPVEGTGVLAPKLIENRCVGCGLCQTRCRAVNVAEKHLIDRSAIVVEKKTT